MYCFFVYKKTSLDLEAGVQRDFTSGHVYCFGSLGEASVKHCKQLRHVDSLGDVGQAGGGGSPLGAQEVQGSLSALAGGRVVAEYLVLAHPVLPTRQVEGEVELLLVAGGKALIPEQLYKL